jgi:hypothetical protein
MDLLRLALERAETAKNALDIIINLLERYGQGGNCGYDKRFEYDNAFLIMDKDDIFVLDTHNKDWAYKRMDKASISNALNLEEADKSTVEGENFTQKFSDPLFTHFSGAKKRRASTHTQLKTGAGPEDMFGALRSHSDDVANPFAKGSVSSVCMHAGGLVGDHTTQSMVAVLDGSNSPLVWQTGGSTPCVSLFKPYVYGNKAVGPVYKEGDEKALEYWLNHERFVRLFLGNEVPDEYYAQRDELESEFIKWAKAERYNLPAMEELALYALEKEREFEDKWTATIKPGTLGSPRFKRYWAKKNQLLGKERPKNL